MIKSSIKRRTINGSMVQSKSWSIMEYHGVSCIMMDYHGLSWNIDWISSKTIPGTSTGSSPCLPGLCLRVRFQQCHPNRWAVEPGPVPCRFPVRSFRVVDQVHSPQKRREPLVNSHISIWKDPPCLMGKSSVLTGSFSTAMLNYQRVLCWFGCWSLTPKKNRILSLP